MSEKDKKRVFNKHSFYDRSHIQQYLEDMAGNGWMLEKVTSFCWHFKRIEPQKLHFSINYFPPASEFDADPSEDLLTIRDYCAHAGWDFVTARAQMQIYCNAQNDPTPIETDPLVEVDTIHKAMKKNFLPSQLVLLLLGIMQIVLQGYLFFTNPINYLVVDFNFMAIFCWLSVIALCLIEIVGYLQWHKKARRAAELDGEFINTPSYRRPVYTILWVNLMIFTVYFLTLIHNRLIFVFVLLIIAMICTFFFTIFLMNWMKRKKASARINRIVTVTVSFLVGFLLMMGITFGGIQLIHSDYFTDAPRYDTYTYNGHEFRIYNDVLPLTISDLMDTDYTEYSCYWEGRESIVLGEYEGFQRPRLGALEEPSLRYTVYYVKQNALYDMCIHELLHQYDDLYDEDIPEKWRDNFRAVDANVWNANKVYQKYTGDVSSEQYILCYDEIIVELTPGFELTDEQKPIISEKLNQPNWIK